MFSKLKKINSKHSLLSCILAGARGYKMTSSPTVRKEENKMQTTTWNKTVKQHMIRNTIMQSIYVSYKINQPVIPMHYPIY
jgi:hypothetical protein